MKKIFSLEISNTADERTRELIVKYWELKKSEKAVFKFSLDSLANIFCDLEIKSAKKIHNKIESFSYLYETEKQCVNCGDRIKILNRKLLKKYYETPKSFCELCLQKEKETQIYTAIEYLATYIDELYCVMPSRSLTDLVYIESIFLDFLINNGLLTENGHIRSDYCMTAIELSIFERLLEDKFIIELSTTSESYLKSLICMDILLNQHSKLEACSTENKFCLSIIEALPEPGLYINPAVLAMRVDIEKLAKITKIKFTDFQNIEKLLIDILVAQLIVELTKNCNYYRVPFDINEATKQCLENLIRKISLTTSIRLVKTAVEKLAAQLQSNKNSKFKLVNRFNSSLERLTNYVINNSEFPIKSTKPESFLGNDFLDYVSGKLVNSTDIYYQKPANEVLKIWSSALMLDEEN